MNWQLGIGCSTLIIDGIIRTTNKLNGLSNRPCDEKLKLTVQNVKENLNEAQRFKELKEGGLDFK